MNKVRIGLFVLVGFMGAASLLGMDTPGSSRLTGEQITKTSDTDTQRFTPRDLVYSSPKSGTGNDSNDTKCQFFAVCASNDGAGIYGGCVLALKQSKPGEFIVVDGREVYKVENDDAFKSVIQNATESIMMFMNKVSQDGGTESFLCQYDPKGQAIQGSKPSASLPYWKKAGLVGGVSVLFCACLYACSKYDMLPQWITSVSLEDIKDSLARMWAKASFSGK